MVGTKFESERIVKHGTKFVTVVITAKGGAMSPQEREEFKAPTSAKYAAESSAYFSSARLWDDGV